MKTRLWGILFVSVLLIPLRVSANTVAIDFTSTQNWGFGAGLTIGWGFTISQPLTVNQLGYYDNGQDGFVFDHDVGLFRVSDMSLITSATVTTADPLDGLFRYTNIAPVTINPGDAYFLAGYDPEFCPGGLNPCRPDGPPDPHDRVGNPPFADISFAPQIAFEGWQTESGPALQFTTYNPSLAPWANSDGPLIVANMKFEPVPVPAAIWLFGSGLVLLVTASRRRKSVG